MQGLRQRGSSVIGFVNQKGGVGKTTSVLQVALALAKMRHRVLLVDGDPQGNLSLFFGKKEGHLDLYHLFLDTMYGTMAAVDRYIYPDITHHLDILPVYENELRIKVRDHQMERVAHHFVEYFQGFRSRYDWVLIDCSPSSSYLEHILISCCDSLIVPLEFQWFSRMGLKGLSTSVQGIAERTHRIIHIDALLFTKVEKNVNRMKEYREIFQDYGIPIFEVAKSEILPKSIELSQSVWDLAPTSYIAHDYFRFLAKIFFGVDTSLQAGSLRLTNVLDSIEQLSQNFPSRFMDLEEQDTFTSQQSAQGTRFQLRRQIAEWLDGEWMADQYIVGDQPFVEHFRVEKAAQGIQLTDLTCRMRIVIRGSILSRQINVAGTLAGRNHMKYQYTEDTTFSLRIVDSSHVAVLSENGFTKEQQGTDSAVINDLQRSLTEEIWVFHIEMPRCIFKYRDLQIQLSRV